MTRSVNGTDSTRVRDCKFRTLRRKPSQPKAPTAKRRIQIPRRCGIAGGIVSCCRQLEHKLVRLSPCAPLPTARRTHSSACLCSTARFANSIWFVLYQDKYSNEQIDGVTFWDIVLRAWRGQSPYERHVAYFIDGLVCKETTNEVSDGEGSSGGLTIYEPIYKEDEHGTPTNEPEGYQCPLFAGDDQFDEIRATRDQPDPTTRQLKKKFEEFLQIFVPLYRPAAEPAKYAGLESINDQTGLRRDLQE